MRQRAEDGKRETRKLKFLVFCDLVYWLGHVRLVRDLVNVPQGSRQPLVPGLNSTHSSVNANDTLFSLGNALSLGAGR